MLDDFFIRVLIVGFGVVVVVGFLGCFVVWCCMFYFGDMFFYVVFLGVVLVFLMDINIMFVVVGVLIVLFVILVFL